MKKVFARLAIAIFISLAIYFDFLLQSHSFYALILGRIMLAFALPISIVTILLMQSSKVERSELMIALKNSLTTLKHPVYKILSSTAKIWQTPDDRPVRAILLVSRVLILLSIIYVWYLLLSNDPRFTSPELNINWRSNPKIMLMLAALPLTVIMLYATFMIRSTWVAVVLVISLGSLEFASYLYLSIVHPRKSSALVLESEGGPLWNPGCYKIGLCLQPNASQHVVATANGKTIYDVTYEAGPNGTRLALDKNDTHQRPVFAAFFGDSNTFGMTVTGTDTLPGQLGKILCSIHPYNFAMGGGTTSIMLAEFETGLVRKTVNENSGYFIYVYGDHHILRNVGDTRTLTFGKRFPAYDFDTTGKLEYKGTLWTYRPLRNALSTLAHKLNILNILGFRVPESESPEDVKLTTAIILNAYNISKKEYPNSEFIVISASESQYIDKELEGTGIRVLDYSKVVPSETPNISTPYDGHGSPVFHRMFAEQLAKDLNIQPDCNQL